MVKRGLETQRIHERAPFCGSVALCRDRMALPLKGLDIGPGGIFLDTEDTLPERRLVTLRITMPGPGKQAFTVLGQVVRTRRGDRVLHTSGVAVKFLDIMPRDRECVREYVTRTLGRSAA